MRDVPALPTPVPYITPHPANGHAHMGDVDLAMLRHIQAECHQSTSMVTLALGLYYTFFFREPIPAALLISRAAFSLGSSRLSMRDEKTLAEKINSKPWGLFYLITDDTHDDVEKHQIQISAIDVQTVAPRFHLLSNKMGLQKSAESNGSENLKQLGYASISTDTLGGGAGDRPSLPEYTEMGKKLGRRLLAFPGQAHTFALDHKHFSFAIFGEHTGLKDRSHGVQWLHTLKFVWTKSTLENCRLASHYMGGIEGPWDLTPKDPNVGRWLYVSYAARHINKFRKAMCAAEKELADLLLFMSDMEYQGKQSNREMWNYLCDMCDDDRFIVFCVFEDEYASVVYELRLGHLRTTTRQGWKGAFGIMDYAEHHWHVDMAVTKKLVSDYQQVLPLTHAQVEKVRLSTRFGGLVASNEERAAAANALADDLHKRIQHGATMMEKEQKKNYKHLEEVPFIFLFMFCCGRAGACVRAMLTLLHGVGKFQDLLFTRADETREDDAWFLSRMKGSVEELDELFLMLQFYNDDLKLDFARLSTDLMTDRHEDTLVAQFVRGMVLKPLFSHCVQAIGALPVDESIVELLFSAEKTVHRPNGTRQQTTNELVYQQNKVAPLRSARVKMVGAAKISSNHETHAQVAKAGEQMLRLARDYNEAAMVGIDSRRKFQGYLKGSDVAQADAAVKKKIEERTKQTGRVAPSAETVRKRRLHHSATLSNHEVVLAAKGAVTQEDRRHAVIFEQKFEGQVGRAEIFFGKSMDSKTTSVLLRKAFPLVFGFALPLIDASEVAWWWSVRSYGGVPYQQRPTESFAIVPVDSLKSPAEMERRGLKKANAPEKLKAVRGMRDALLLPRVRKLKGEDSPYEFTHEGKMVEYRGVACVHCKKAHVGCVLCFLTPQERVLLGCFGFSWRTKGVNEIELEATARSGMSVAAPLESVAAEPLAPFV
jgi:hypothetical protein